MKSTNQGILWAFLAALISGVSIFVNKFAVSAIGHPLVFTTSKNLAVAVILFTGWLLSKNRGELKKLNRKQLSYLLTVGVVGGSLPFYLFFTGLSAIPAANAAIIHKSLVLWIAVLAPLFLNERLSKFQAVLVLSLFSANAFIGGFEGFKYSRGEMMILLATFLWSLENILAKKILPQLSAGTLATFRMGVGSVLLLGATLATTSHPLAYLNLNPQNAVWLTVTILALCGYVLTWYKALKLSQAVTVSSILVSATLVTNTLSAVFVTKTWSWPLGLQCLLILAVITLLTVDEVKRGKVSDLATAKT